jgi:hypothetical protein
MIMHRDLAYEEQPAQAIFNDGSHEWLVENPLSSINDINGVSSTAYIEDFA